MRKERKKKEDIRRYSVRVVEFSRATSTCLLSYYYHREGFSLLGNKYTLASFVSDIRKQKGRRRKRGKRKNKKIIKSIKRT